MARGLLRRSSSQTAGLWPRATALLARQALEIALAREWRAVHAGLAACPTRVQLLCLCEFSSDWELMTRATHVWGALSDACHHHAYAAPPGAAELEAWFATVEQVAGLSADLPVHTTAGPR